jgi:hypothetical protein
MGKTKNVLRAIGVLANKERLNNGMERERWDLNYVPYRGQVQDQRGMCCLCEGGEAQYNCSLK